MKITPRRVSDYIGKPGYSQNGTSYYWSRTINGIPYRFTLVIMPDGERRYAVSKYNGYCADSIAKGFSALDAVLQFGCAWSEVHFITVRA